MLLPPSLLLFGRHRGRGGRFGWVVRIGGVVLQSLGRPLFDLRYPEQVTFCGYWGSSEVGGNNLLENKWRELSEKDEPNFLTNFFPNLKNVNVFFKNNGQLFISRHLSILLFIRLCARVHMCVCVCAYILLLSLLYKKSLPIITELHMQVDWLSIHFNVDLQQLKT